MGKSKLTNAAGKLALTGSFVNLFAPNLLPLVQPIIDTAVHQMENRVKVPLLYEKDFPIELEEAIKTLDNCGLKTTLSKISVNEANSKYKDCRNFQIVDSMPKQGTSVKIGTSVILRYVTDEVIEESKRLYDKEQQYKAYKQEKKLADRNERIEQVKHGMEQAKDGVVYAANKTRREVKKIVKTGNNKLQRIKKK